MTLPRLYADFNGPDVKGRLRLNCYGTFDDLSHKKMWLQEGACMTFYDDECEADGTVRYSDEERIWVGEIDWDAVRHHDGSADVPDEATAEANP